MHELKRQAHEISVSLKLEYQLRNKDPQPPSRETFSSGSSDDTEHLTNLDSTQARRRQNKEKSKSASKTLSASQRQRNANKNAKELEAAVGVHLLTIFQRYKCKNQYYKNNNRTYINVKTHGHLPISTILAKKWSDLIAANMATKETPPASIIMDILTEKARTSKIKAKESTLLPTPP